MEKSKKTSFLPLAAFILGSALLWGAAILGCSLKLKGTDCYADIQNILSLGAGFHLIMIWGPLAAMYKRLNRKNE